VHLDQLPHSPQAQFTTVVVVVVVVVGQPVVSHTSCSTPSPLQFLPGGCVLAFVATRRLRLRTPPPQVTVHVVHLFHSPQAQSTLVTVVVVEVVVGQKIVLHSSLSSFSPLQFLPGGCVLAFVATTRLR
jgi:hypothetical protein